ncbi:hypothetical protein PVK06_045805 [Gossypium arboreum]|uniref:Uncharacterized protein n=1 Tax=Gossypium arboreum TaxID=29729 RepID=A0ABR0MV26_GOSAR|nr:hypothetical protein PVK06_045805 [Gossypium arboreum]
MHCEKSTTEIKSKCQDRRTKILKYGAYIPSKPVGRRRLKAGAEKASVVVNAGNRGSNRKTDEAMVMGWSGTTQR